MLKIREELTFVKVPSRLVRRLVYVKQELAVCPLSAVVRNDESRWDEGLWKGETQEWSLLRRNFGLCRIGVSCDHVLWTWLELEHHSLARWTAHLTPFGLQIRSNFALKYLETYLFVVLTNLINQILHPTRIQAHLNLKKMQSLWNNIDEVNASFSKSLMGQTRNSGFFGSLKYSDTLLTRLVVDNYKKYACLQSLTWNGIWFRLVPESRSMVGRCHGVSESRPTLGIADSEGNISLHQLANEQVLYPSYLNVRPFIKPQ